MKKWMLFLVVLSMLAFAGCGNKEEAAPEPQEQAAEESAADVEAISKSDATTLQSLLEKEASLGSYTYSVEVEMMDGVKSSVTIYKKLPWMRMESTVEDLPTAVTLMNADEGKLYTIDEANKQIMVLSDTDMFVDPSAGIDAILEEGMVPEGMELEKTEYKGQKAYLLDYSFDDPESGETIGSKVWYDADMGVPLAYEINMGAEQSMLTEFTYDFGEVSDELFKLPEDYTVMDLGDMDSMFDNMDMEDMNMEDMNN